MMHNRSRWPVHPLWQDLIERIKGMECQGVHRVIDEKEVLNERLMRIAISTYGNLKRIGAIHAVRQENVGQLLFLYLHRRLCSIKIRWGPSDFN